MKEGSKKTRLQMGEGRRVHNWKGKEGRERAKVQKENNYRR